MFYMYASLIAATLIIAAAAEDFDRAASSAATAGSNYAQSVAWADVDGDGDQDLFVGNRGQKNALYLNDGKSKLSAAAPSAATAGSESTWSVAWADADGDGDADLFVGNYGQKNALYLNDGRGKLSAAASSAATAGSESTVS